MRCQIGWRPGGRPYLQGDALRKWACQPLRMPFLMLPRRDPTARVRLQKEAEDTTA